MHDTPLSSSISPSTPPRRLSPRSTLLLAAPWVVAAVLWLADALAAPGDVSPPVVDGITAWAVVASAATLLGLVGMRLWCSGWSGRTLLALGVVAATTYCTGLGQEVLGRYFGDEGIYLAQARRIHEIGQLLRPWFIYPHLLFYLDAFALWLADGLGPVVPWLARTVYGAEEAAAVEPLVTRLVTASLGAGTVVPVFVTARRIAGPVAGALGGGLIAMCPVFIEVSHLNISDVVGGFFAAMTVMQCALLLHGESRRGYLLAGLWAGLAAGGKYPAGVVAVAVFGVWLGWRLREKNLRPGLLWAAGATIASFLSTTPSFLAFPGAVVAGEGSSDVLFGFRQYAQSGWTGVVRASNSTFYLALLRQGFGLPALLLGLVGIPLLDREARRRLLWLAPFPVAYLALMLSMRIALDRNLMPVLPALAAAVGAGAVGWVHLAQRRAARAAEKTGRDGLGRRRTAVLVAVACLALPAWRSVVTTVRFARPTTRELAAEWMPRHLPPGSALVQEVYTPHIHPEHLYPSARPRFVVRMRPEQMRDPRFDFVFVASSAYARFFDQEALDDRYEEGGRERYEEIFETFEPVAEWTPDRFRAGPRLRLFELDPERPPWSDRIERSARAPGELLTASPGMRPDGSEGAKGGPDRVIRFDATGQWALAKGYLEPGTYTVSVEGELADTGGGVQVLTRTGEEVDVDLFFADRTARVDLPRREKVFVYVRLPPGSTLRTVRIERVDRLGQPGAGGPPGGEAPLG